MKTISTSLLIAVAVAAVVYFGIAIPNYYAILAHQPVGPPPFQKDVTSFPPYYAFFAAAPFSIVALVAAFCIAYAATLIRNRLQKNRS